MVDVIQYVACLLQAKGLVSTDFLLLLDPSSPLRDPAAFDSATERICQTWEIDGFAGWPYLQLIHFRLELLWGLVGMSTATLRCPGCLPDVKKSQTIGESMAGSMLGKMNMLGRLNLTG
jgi:hypothetical protein